MRRLLSIASTTLLATSLCALTAVSAPVASAATVAGNEAGYATFTLGGGSGAYTGSMQLPGRFPSATITSNSRGAAGTATSQYIRASTEPAQSYGESRSSPGNNFTYLNLRPRNNTLGAGGSSTTTYDFAAPTPASGWMFTLGDVDADQVTISATDASGAPVSNADLGFRSTFNYIDNASNQDAPSWNPATATLTGNGVDTDGAAGWFEPSVALSTLTFEFTALSGQPVFQTWFATRANDISGTVSCAASPEDVPGGLEAELRSGAGDVITTAEVSSDGTYAFTGFLATDDYEVHLVSTDPAAIEPASRAVDISTSDATGVDFDACATTGISGTIACEDGTVPAGVVVRLEGNGQMAETSPAANGSYMFDDLPPGAYTVQVIVPAGGEATTATSQDVQLSGDPVTGIDFGVCETPDDPGAGNGSLGSLDATGSLGTGSLDATGSLGTGSAVIGGSIIGGSILGSLAPGSIAPDGSLGLGGPLGGGSSVDLGGHAGPGSSSGSGALPPLGAGPGATGHVLWHGIKPAPGIVVSVTGPGGCRDARTTGLLGEYRLDGLADGWYEATVVPPPGAAASEAVHFEVVGGQARIPAVTLELGGSGSAAHPAGGIAMPGPESCLA